VASPKRKSPSWSDSDMESNSPSSVVVDDDGSDREKASSAAKRQMLQNEFASFF